MTTIDISTYRDDFRLGRVPTDWKAAKLGDLLSECQYGLSKSLADSGKYPVFRMNNIIDGRMVAYPLAYIDLPDGEFARYRLRKGDVLLNRTNSLELVGKVGLFDLEGDFVFASYLIRLAVRNPNDPRFINYFLNSYQGQRRIRSKVTPAISQANINTRSLKSVWLPQPTPEEQRLIADKLDEIHNIIAGHKMKTDALETLQMGLMQQVITGRLKPDGTPRAQHEFWEHPKVGLVPNGWAVSPLKQLATIQRGKFSHRPRNEPRFFGGPYPFIQTADIVASRGYIRSHSQTLSEEGRSISRMFPKGTIMITIAANIGDTAILSYDMFATDSVIGITPKDGVDSEYLELCLRMRKSYLERMSTESAQANINYGNLRPLLIVHPVSVDEQKAVAAPIIACENLILAREQKIAALQLLKKSLMQNLLTGHTRLVVNGSTKNSST